MKRTALRQRILGKVGKRIIFRVLSKSSSYLNQPGVLLLCQLQLLLLLLTRIHHCYRLLLGKVACKLAMPNRMIEKNSTWCCHRNNPKYATPCTAQYMCCASRCDNIGHPVTAQTKTTKMRH